MKVIWGSFYDSVDLRFVVGLRRRPVSQKTLYSHVCLRRRGARNTKMAGDTGTSRLNNYLQGKGRLSSLTWEEVQEESDDSRTWTCTCKVDGTQRGKGTATKKHEAKDVAADQAWTWLNNPES